MFVPSCPDTSSPSSSPGSPQGQSVSGHLSCCAGSSRPHWLCRARASACSGFSCCGPWALRLSAYRSRSSWAQQSWRMALNRSWADGGLPGAGTQPGSPALAGDFKSQLSRYCSISPSSAAVFLPLCPLPRPTSASDLGFRLLHRPPPAAITALKETVAP